MEWVLRHHEVYQMKYYAHHYEGVDPDKSDQWEDHEFHDACVVRYYVLYLHVTRCCSVVSLLSLLRTAVRACTC